MQTKTFEELLLEAIDNALTSLGETAKKSIYFHLQKKFKIAKQDIPENIEEFTSGLGKIFGIGAKYIEILIMKQIYQRIGQPLEWSEDKELVFSEYVNAARKSFSKKQNTHKSLKN